MIARATERLHHVVEEGDTAAIRFELLQIMVASCPPHKRTHNGPGWSERAALERVTRFCREGVIGIDELIACINAF